MLFRRHWHSLHQSSVAISRVLQIRLTSSVANSKLGSTKQQDTLHFNFFEEPLGLPASEGCGYFQGGPGVTFGPKLRYKLLAKLGFGKTSSVWLARDCIKDVHVAVKILTGYATGLNRELKLHELDVLQRLSPVTINNHCAKLLTHFVYPGIDDDKEHLCLVTELFSSNLENTLKAQQGGFIPIPAVKRILTQVLVGIARLHGFGIVHTDIKLDNIMVCLEPRWSTGAIDTWLKKNPPRTHAPERSYNNKMVSAYVSQSLPPPLLDALPSCNFKLAGLSSVQIVSNQTADNDITTFDLRPPEVVLGGRWNESVDIWSFGCLVFSLLTRRPLFKPMASTEHNASEVDVLLYQMISFCGESFKQDFLQRCSRSMDYFWLDCRLKKFQSIDRKPFQECILDSGCTLDPEDLAGAADLMTKCLRLDPKDRVTARELFLHPWLML